MAFLPNNNIKFHDLPISNTTDSFAGIIAGDGSLVDKDVFLGVIAVNEAVAALNVEPFYNTSNLVGNNLFLWHSFWLFWLFLWVGHDVSGWQKMLKGTLLLDGKHALLVFSFCFCRSATASRSRRSWVYRIGLGMRRRH